MFFIECEKCDVTAAPYHATAEGWIQVQDDFTRGKYAGKWFCPEHAEDAPTATATKFVNPVATIHDMHEHIRKTVVGVQVPPAVTPQGWTDRGTEPVRGPQHPRPERHPLQEEFGFTRPEDGSEERYHVRKAEVPWVRHAFWWWVHNAVAHPMIALFPKRFAFRFHDYTSHKMHGE